MKKTFESFNLKKFSIFESFVSKIIIKSILDKTALKSLQKVQKD